MSVELIKRFSTTLTGFYGGEGDWRDAGMGAIYTAANPVDGMSIKVDEANWWLLGEVQGEDVDVLRSMLASTASSVRRGLTDHKDVIVDLSHIRVTMNVYYDDGAVRKVQLVSLNQPTQTKVKEVIPKETYLEIEGFGDF